MRYQYLDILRWACIVLMILFHFYYSLDYILGMRLWYFSEFLWSLLWRISALGFMIISGFSFFLAYEKYGTALSKKYFRYALVLMIIALGISVVTILFIPDQKIIFGILHFFALSFLLLPFCAKLWYYTGLLAWILLYLWIYFPYESTSYFLFPFGVIYPGFYSADYYPLLPYFWYVLGWFCLWKYIKDISLLHFFHLKRDMNFIENVLNNLWKKSLMIYIIHQPIIYITLYLYLFLKAW